MSTSVIPIIMLLCYLDHSLEKLVNFPHFDPFPQALAETPAMYPKTFFRKVVDLALQK